MNIFKISQHAERDKIILAAPTVVATDAAATAWTGLTLGGANYLVAYAKASGTTALIAVGGDDAVHQVQIETGADLINTFTLGDALFLMSYTKQSGSFQIRRIRENLTLGTALSFRRTHEPGTTAGFTTVGVFDQGNRPAFMGYDHETGRVTIFNFEMTARGVEGGPPIAVHNSWAHQWATGWTRFAFFALGDETFFLKTNDIWHNVNIDHINRNPELGTNEVATRMNLIDAYDIALVAPLALGHGDPYFVAYKPDGQMIVYRIHADCAGWTKVAEVTAPAGARGLQCFAAGDDGLIVLV